MLFVSATHTQNVQQCNGSPGYVRCHENEIGSYLSCSKGDAYNTTHNWQDRDPSSRQKLSVRVASVGWGNGRELHYGSAKNRRRLLVYPSLFPEVAHGFSFACCVACGYLHKTLSLNTRRRIWSVSIPPNQNRKHYETIPWTSALSHFRSMHQMVLRNQREFSDNRPCSQPNHALPPAVSLDSRSAVLRLKAHESIIA